MGVSYGWQSTYWALLIPLFYVGALGWIIVVVVLALKGDTMDRSDRVAQLYGYTVCLIAVIVFIISVMSISDSLFKAADPLHGEGYTPVNLSSFETYKATAEQPTSYSTDRNGTSTVQKPSKPSDAELRARYEALRSDRLASAHLEAEHSLTNALIMFVVAIGLFGFHWRWLRSRVAHAPA